MKTILIALLNLLLVCQGYAQREFTTYDNGLIYSKPTMTKLERIVDSLNLKYKTCELKTFFSKSQVVAHIVLIDSNVADARRDIEYNTPFDLFLLKHPYAKVERNVLIVKFRYKGYEEKDMVEFSEVNPGKDYGLRISKKYSPVINHYKVAGSWILDDYEGDRVYAIYFPGNFTSGKLPDHYARQVGYADCLIDTNSAKFKENARNGSVSLPKDWVELPTKKKEQLLDKMRSTRVVGQCSQDDSPRIHAINIALLSAETSKWEVFLKSHLDIMNDRFDRVTDGSYAWGERETYIRELEQLNINVLDLMIGISLRVENSAANHYYGSIGRLGRAIAESKNKKEFETQMLSMIADKTLDDYNRVLAYYLFLNYNYYVKDKTQQTENITRLNQSINKLPDYLQLQIASKKK